MPSLDLAAAARRQRRRKLRKLANETARKILSGELVGHPECAYPTCRLPRVSEDCCYAHSIDGRVSGAPFLPNDGIIDWQAVYLARQGARAVRLTWVEYEIAGAYILLDGESQDEMRERTGIHCRSGGERLKRMQEVADVLRAAA
jgi:hypothetical protein